ncbi:MAG: hypothetical protein ACREK2_00860, partial [Gemmatimonadota bacterium]
METARKAGGLVVLTALTALLTSSLHAQSIEQSPWSYDQDMRMTYEIDDNVAERIEEDDPVRAQVARLAYRGDLRWGASSEQRLSISYQGGVKRHFGFTEFDVTSQFINEGTVGYQRRIVGNVALGGTVGIKNRAWTDGFFFINEDGFTRVSGSVSGLVNLTPLSEGESARLEIGGRYSDTDFENLDAAFGNHLIGA